MTQAIDEPALLRRLREGQDAAFSELFEQHAPAVRRLALGLAKDRTEAEDITAETFFRVLRAVKRGNGPKDNIRAYLLTVARRVSWEWKGAVQDVPVTDDELTSRAGAAESNPSRAAEHSLITKAFTSLPERWRTVLWQTEVEGAKPAVVAPQIGLSPNATAALARRARLGLRAAYLQAHLATSKSDGGCRSVLEKLGGYTAGSVTGTEADRISAHLTVCARCHATHDELRDVCFSLRANANGIAVAGAAAAAGAGASGASGASGAATTASWSGAFKTAFTSAKVKVGIAVASTAAAGVFGFSVGPAMTETASEYFGLVGEQGISQTTPDNAPSLERGPDNGYPLPDASRTRDGDSSTRDTRRTKDREDRSSQQPAPATDSTVPSPEPAAALPKPGTPKVDVEAGAKPEARVTPDAPSKAPRDSRKTEPPSRTGAPERSAPPSDTNRPTPATSSPPPNQGQEPGRSAYERCVDDSYSSDTYNAQRNRREVHQFSYADGEGYESYEYYYDNGRYELYEYYWYDSCP